MRKVPVMNGQVIKNGSYIVCDMDENTTTNLIKLPFVAGTMCNRKSEGWKVQITDQGHILLDCYKNGKRIQGLDLQLVGNSVACKITRSQTPKKKPEKVAPKRFKDYAWLRKLKGKTQERS